MSAPEQMDIAQLMHLINQSKTKQDDLSRLASQQVIGQPVKRPDQSMYQFLTGRGNDQTQARGLNQFYGAILNRDKTKQTASGAASDGFERGHQLIDQIRTTEKGERIAGAQQAASAAQQALKNSGDLYGMQQADANRQAVYDASLARTLSTAENARLGRENTAGIADRRMGQRDAHRQEDRDIETEAARQAQLAAARKGKNESADVYQNLADIQKNISGDTTGNTGRLTAWAFSGSDAAAQKGRIASLHSKLATSKLQEMRAASKDGSSGFGQLTVAELDLLIASIDQLVVGQSAERQREAIGNITKYYDKAIQRYDDVMQAAYGAAPGGGAGGATQYSGSANKYLQQMGVTQ